MKESDLYLPVKQYFSALGYEVKSEINGCDVVAISADPPQTIIVELKTTFNIPLLVQAAKRKALSPFVYVAVPYQPRTKKRHSFTWNEAILLCRHLQIGLITIQYYKRRDPRIEIRYEPPETETVRITRRQKRLTQEFHERSGDYQLGGIHREKIVTAYRERALQCAYYLRDGQPKSLADIRAAFADERIVRLLQNNFYGWFTREKRGVYKITPAGLQALNHYAEIVRNLSIPKH